MIDLRTYQVDAIDSVIDSFKKHSSALVVMPTGTGKTVVVAHAARLAQKGRVLVLAHREELVMQMAKTLEEVGLTVAIEMGETTAAGSWWNKPDAVVATVQTLTASDCRRLHELIDDPTDWSLTVIDEAHHAPSKSYQMIADHMFKNTNHRLLGVTATPDRTDKLAMGTVFETVAYEYSIEDAISDGYLVPISQRAVYVEGLDYREVRSTAGELNGKDLAKVMEDEHNLHAMATPTFDIAEGRKTVVFCSSVDQAERFSEILNRTKPGCSRWVAGITPKEERRLLFRDFDDGNFQFLVNCMIATEGWDCPTVQCVALARATCSRSLYCQMVGRGLRPLPGITGSEEIAGSEKSKCLVIDFKGNAGKHKLVTAADILDGRWPKEVRERAAEIAEESGDERAIDELCEEAAAQIEAEKERERLAAIAKRAKLRAEVKFTTKEFSPFNALDIEPPKWEAGDAPSSDKQVMFLKKFGINAVEMTHREASRIQREVFRRMKSGLCTVKQASVLKKHGHSTNVSKNEATRIISRMFDGDMIDRRTG
mgnify:CR=1 FL=1